MNKQIIDLEFWMAVYDRAIEEEQSAHDDNDWYREHIGRPYSKKQLEELKKIDDRVRRAYKLQGYIRNRILKYNR